MPRPCDRHQYTATSPPFYNKELHRAQVEKESSEKTVMELVRKEDRISKNLENKKISKIFFVKNRLINIVLDD